ncbi:MAG: crossover junction endodeoxyribonuclease RuvC [Candidatus Liptonbacteria bacterium]|nr:crossover junction endodeoxyribonuclease RuvC [Candidatus Liptonbacteria bacterium]
MLIIGIDPGSRRIGYGLIEKTACKINLITAGILRIKAKNDPSALVETKNHFLALIKKYRPTVLAIEKLYFAKNQKTAMAVAESRGVIIFLAKESGLIVREFSPSVVKAGITGYGSADKKAVAKMVKIILNQPELQVIDDVSDALAAAILASQKVFSS